MIDFSAETPSVRSRSVAWEAGKRAAERDVPEREPENKERRLASEVDCLLWLSTYMPETFCGEWTDTRREMVAAILAAATYGGDQAIAAPRGEGKTSVVEGVVIYCILLGILRFPLICAATGPDSERILNNIKMQFELNDLLWADYPEVCDPVRALDGAPQRAGMQTRGGLRTRMKWSGDKVVFPTARDSKASGAVLMTRGLDAAIRGIRYGTRRPDLVIIDDPETSESINSDVQTQRREETIERDIGGLGGPGVKLSRLLLTTIGNRRCLSYKYTDPVQKSSWKGRRHRMMEAWPENERLWDEYITLRNADHRNGDDHARNAHAHYLANREAMDLGAVVGNPTRFIKDVLPDGSQLEVSAIQHAFNIIADRGREAFDTEYQNDPPEEEMPEGSGLTSATVQSKCNGYDHRLVPAGTIAVTAAIDVGKYRFHWSVVAWQADATGRVIDYGIQDTGALAGHDEGALDRIILSALHQWREESLAEPYFLPGGEVRRVDRVFVDAGYRDEAVYQFIRETGGVDFLPSRGQGESADRRSTFYANQKPRPGAKPGDHWRAELQPSGVWLVLMDSDHWKRWIHDRWLTPIDRPGTLTLFGTDPTRHLSFAKHQVAEEETEEFVRGKGIVKKWVKVSKNNHWFDAVYMNAVAASMCGVRLFAPPQQHVVRKPGVVHRMQRPDGKSFLARR